MGKYHKGERKSEDTKKYYFDVTVAVHGKNPHTETYSMFASHVEDAKGLGYLGKGTTYLDWKPLNGNKDFEGGLFYVYKYTSDDKYVYAYTDKSNKPTFSLPKYLAKRLDPGLILVGKRERSARRAADYNE